MAHSVGTKVKQADNSSVSIAPTAAAAKVAPQVATAHVSASEPNHTYFVGGKFVSVDVEYVSFDDTPITNLQVVSGLVTTA